ncbi:TNT domain-containing protein [Amycolatopsis anabasis]|uniref:TNT domain-containing protein n=1 Tax=Amycolatopsis anabasis TaxID=1840409 RepID=UPI00131C73B5|nr:TNT domain-containing protein [Amycolatopsis anabasis]
MDQPDRGGDPHRALLARIGRLLRDHAPTGWQRLEAGFRQAGAHTEVELYAGDHEIPAPGELAALLGELRAGMYEPDRGAWLQARYTLDDSGAFDFDFALDAEPVWRRPPEDPAGVFAKELADFPRTPEHVPDWWRLLSGAPLSRTFHHARVVDAYTEGEPPVVDRPPLPEAEVPLVLRYLEREPAVLSGNRPGPDIFAPDAAPDVPETYHTDGTWVWHASVPHYLRKYGTPPENELVEHIRGLNFQPPYVEHLVRRTVAADLLGRPRPAPEPGDLAKAPAELAAEREVQPNPALADEDLLTVLAARLDEHGIWPDAYRIGERADGAWCLNGTAAGWEVARHAGGEPVDPVRFTRLADAAQHLLGALLLHPARRTAGRETPLETARELGDWPIQPVDGEPPLTLLRNKRVIQLAAGTVLRRFGDETGNLLHRRGVRFATTSLPLEREVQAREYRLQRTLHAVTGITIPWANLPGGAIAYVLPKTIGEHVSEGSLIEES